ncbi:MAG TPA: histidine kinase dimerization/phosphoacceptor domain -containing protein, partial [Dissulfurispiraceae bacterium]|nr:histidine kinase dimerization/phosphoacceptor domain -containing protein [Dissulfurispiraceae bacterium]
VPVQMTGRNMEYDGRTAIRIAIREMTAGRRVSESGETPACHPASFVEHAQDLMWSLDERLRLSAANAAFRMFFLLLYGIRISPGMMLMNYVPGDVRALIASMYNRGVRGEETKVEHRFNFNGAAVDIEIACSPVITDERTIAGASFVARDVTDRRKREEDIRISLRDKDVLMQEAYHRIKNNLQVIASLLNIQAEKVRDKESLDMFKESLNRVKAMSLIHENLYRAKDFTRIDFGEYMRTLVDYLFRAYGANVTRIKSRVSAPAVVMDVNQAMSCGLIVNELVSNSLKYAFPPSIEGEVYVEVRPRDDGYVTLVAGDTGVGLPKDIEIKQTKSLGLQLVNSLVNQLKGTIVLQDKAGTEFMITFPVLPVK